MKRLSFALAAAALWLPFAQLSKGADVSVDFFYNNLSGGDWIEVADYGYVWQPSVAVSNTSWRPYSDGYWAYTDLGWTWVSYEDFGWATYHYGRWARLSDYGWVWVPGRDEDIEWGPAWVSWRTGGDYVGWAPLPPAGVRVYEGRAITGRVDIDFNIGPAYYNFVDVRYIGEPVLRERIVDVNQNVTYINQTTNVTNITYKNKTVYNYGPDVNALNARAARPIQRLKIERQENADINAAAKSGALVKPQGDKLVIAAPQHVRKAERQLAPQKIKTKVAKANLDTGWSGVSDPNVKTQLQQKMKTEDAKQAQIGAGAAATGQAPTGASPAASASASVGTTAGTSASPMERGKGKHKNKLNAPAQQNAATGAGAAAGAGASTSPAVSPTEATSPAGAAAGGAESGVPGHGKHKGRHPGDQSQALTPPTGGATTSPGPESVTSPAGAAAGADATSQPGGGKHNRRAFEQGAAGQGQAPDLSGDQGQGGGKNKGRRLEQQQPGPQGPGGAGASDLQGARGGKHKGERAAGPAGAGQAQDQAPRDGGKKRKGEAASPAPTP